LVRETEEKKKRTQAEEDLDSQNMALVEAALYVAGRPLDVKTLGSIAGVRSKKKIQRVVRKLMNEYKHRNTSIEILELEDQRFVLQLKSEYSSKVRRLAVRPLLSTGPLKTLSYVAYRQPISQKQLIDVRGGHAYSHIKALNDMGLIEREKEGKTWTIKTTEYFADYFGLSHNPKLMKGQLGRIFDNLVKRLRVNSKTNTPIPKEKKKVI